MMTVAQLRELLADLPDDMPVILSRDPEGNGFSPLDEDYGLESYCFNPECPGPIDLDDDEDIEDHDTGKPVIVLWPTN